MACLCIDPRQAPQAERKGKEDVSCPLFFVEKDCEKRDPRKRLLFLASHAMLKVLQSERPGKPVRVGNCQLSGTHEKRETTVGKAWEARSGWKLRVRGCPRGERSRVGKAWEARSGWKPYCTHLNIATGLPSERPGKPVRVGNKHARPVKWCLCRVGKAWEARSGWKRYR
jgi:hypothetical protein